MESSTPIQFEHGELTPFAALINISGSGLLFFIEFESTIKSK